MSKQIRTPLILIPVAMVTIAGAIWSSYVGGPIYGEKEFAEQIEREDGSTCVTLGFDPATQQAINCKKYLGLVRLQHEKLMASRSF